MRMKYAGNVAIHLFLALWMGLLVLPLQANDMNASPEGEAVQAGSAEAQRVADIEIAKGEIEAVAESTAAANQRLTKVEADLAAYIKTNDAKVRQVGNFSFSGDFRLRYEPFLQEGAATRHRERFRARLNLTGNLSQEFSGGISLATGSLDDPVSTNQTLTGFFNRKNFGLDKAWITYKPNFAKALKLDAGKFAYPWYRTALTFDSDVNPEGFAETLSFNLNSPVLKNITLVGFQLPFNELGSGYDSFVLGGQLQTQFQLSSKVNFGLYGAGININRADPIAVAVGNGTLKPSLANSNTFRYDSTGKTVMGYAYKFTYLDLIAKLDINPSSTWPTTLQFNFVNNTRGSRERSGYWGEITVGRLSAVKSMQFNYALIRVEKDAVIGAWNESDLRSATNVRNHRLQVGYLFKSNLTAQFTAWLGELGNPLDDVSLVPSNIRSACLGANPVACADSTLKRLQFDAIYKF
jgi:hypothetical protein